MLATRFFEMGRYSEAMSDGGCCSVKVSVCSNVSEFSGQLFHSVGCGPSVRLAVRVQKSIAGCWPGRHLRWCMLAARLFVSGQCFLAAGRVWTDVLAGLWQACAAARCGVHLAADGS